MQSIQLSTADNSYLERKMMFSCMKQTGINWNSKVYDMNGQKVIRAGKGKFNEMAESEEGKRQEMKNQYINLLNFDRDRLKLVKD